MYQNSETCYVLGIDVGTSSIKSAVFDLNDPSRPLLTARAPGATVSPRPGWSESDTSNLISRVFGTAREVLEPINGDISAIGISGTAAGAWLLDRRGELIRPPILWNDGRAAQIVDEWTASGIVSRTFDVSGNVLLPGYTIPVLAWLERNEPSSIEVAQKLLFCKDWVRYILTGAQSSDVTDASNAPFDIVNQRWDRAMFEDAGIGQALGLMPEIADELVTAPLLHEAAQAMGTRKGVPVAVGAMDIVAGVVGGGAVREGRVVSILGTCANTSLVTDDPQFEPRGLGFMEVMPLGKHARTMVNTSGSTTLDWAARILTRGDVAQLVELAAEHGTAGAQPVLVPYLSTAGSVSPIVDPNARGVLAGLRVDHGPSDIARAAIDGLAMAVADSYGCLPSSASEITAIGGSARSSRLLQAISDCTDRPVLRPAGEEFGARGVALMAARASDLIGDEEFVSMTESLAREQEFTPDASRGAAMMERYRSVRNAVETLWGSW